MLIDIPRVAPDPPDSDARSMATTMVCHACDLAHRGDAMLAAARVRCVRCRAELYRTHGGAIDTPLALLAAAAILMVLSNASPLVALQMNGVHRTTTLMGAAIALYSQGYVPIAALVLLTTVLVPLFQIAAWSYVLVPLKTGRRAPGQNEVFRILTHLRPWAMPEVFMLGALVAIVKLAALAQVVPGAALFAYGALMLTLAALTHSTPTEQFWQWAGARA